MQIESWWQRIIRQATKVPTRRKDLGRSSRLMEVEVLEHRWVPAPLSNINIYVTGSVTSSISFTDNNRFLDGLVTGLHQIGTSHNFVAANLRSAVEDAQGFGGSNTIWLESNTYKLTRGELQVSFSPQSALTIKNMSGGSSYSTITRNSEETFRLFEVYGGGATTLDHLKLTNGNFTSTDSNTSGTGGAILNHGNLALTYDQIDNNSATGYGGSDFGTGAAGGGVFNDVGATLKIQYSTFDRNTATGGNITSGSFSSAGGGEGGGLGINFDSGAVSITASTFSNNQAIGGNSLAGGEGNSGGTAFGGGIDIADTNVKVTIVNSTFANNTAKGGNGNGFGGFGGNAYGGGIHANDQNTLVLVNDTVALNSALAGPGGNSVIPGTAYGGGVSTFGRDTTVKLVNTIIAKNTAGVVGSTPVSSDVLGSFDDFGHNLIGNTSNASGFLGKPAGDLLNVNPGLDPAGLKNNGGPTQTIALVQGSKAIDAGYNVTTSSPLLTTLGVAPLAYDQRGPGFARKSGPAVDIGAFEVQVASQRGRDLLYNLAPPPPPPPPPQPG